jgi:hypothetical protein
MDKEMNEQQENIQRVNAQISQHVAAFLDRNLNREFHVEELRRYVFDNVQGYVAPASPDRILRDLRQRKIVNYRVVSRSKSLYLSLPKEGELF